ncbi:MAG: glycosyltransferase family A protein [Pseudomonadota bacterium]
MDRLGWLTLKASADVVEHLENNVIGEATLAQADASSASLLSALSSLPEVGHIAVLVDGGARLDNVSLDRLVQCARTTGAGLVYSDHFELDDNGARTLRPLIGWQPGSVRDTFNFGALVILDAALARAAAADALVADSEFSGWYTLRLALSRAAPVVHLPEPTYIRSASAHVRTGVKVFDYLRDEAQRAQKEFERVATDHLRAIDAWCPPPTRGAIDADGEFPVRASVVIPVRDRAATVVEAARSALAQDTGFSFNVIVVDNHSTDGTTEALAALSREDPRLVHEIPARLDLGIGGCWQHAVQSAHCGRYAVQLDSDDLYSGTDVLERIVGAMVADNLAFLVGSYTTVDFDLNPLPPGLIDHREWTDDNGHNNALRIAGLGAPRAFHVPTLRTVGFPNVSFGEDYAVALALSRQYRTGRIYDSLYWCRRWSGNTDSDLSVEQANRNDRYKDRLRTLELLARQHANAGERTREP